MAEADVFKHSTPELYDRYMVPLLFEPFARVVADRAAQLRPLRVLETAAGTGILTAFVEKALPDAEIVATDVNPAVVQFAASKFDQGRVTIQQANAQDLPFENDRFDAVLCQFGVMFFPDKVLAHSEARRVLRAEGKYVMVTFSDLDDNPVPKAADETVNEFFPDDPPRYMERGPFSYTDPDCIEADLRAGGFTGIQFETLRLFTRVTARHAATGMVLGSPLRGEIERRDPASLEGILDAVTQALASFEGRDAPVSAHILTATA